MVDEKGEAGPEKIEELVTTPHLADVLESEQFRHFLDQIPVAIVVSEMAGEERIIYANPEFETISGQLAADVQGKPWSVLRGKTIPADPEPKDLGTAIVASRDFVGTFVIDHPTAGTITADVYSNVIEDDASNPSFRLAAMVNVTTHGTAYNELGQRLSEKDTLLQEVQHRVKNNLQMITALIRLEARNVAGSTDPAPFDRLAGRIEAIGLLYKLLADHEAEDEIDLGVYLSSIASSVMQSHAVEGIRLDLKIDTYPVLIDVAMPAGLVVNELMTNALKHAFRGREGGTITLHSITDENGCRVVVADNGAGLPDGVEWPQRGKLSSLIVRSLRENAHADLTVASKPDEGTRVTIVFTRASVTPNR